MFYRYPINDVHIHLFDPKDIDECIAMVDECGYTNWTFLACTVIDSPFALTQNLLCALVKLKEGGRCQAFGSFHYDGDVVPDADDLLRQIQWFDQAGFDGIKMLDLTNALIVGVILAVIFTVLRPVMRLILSVLNFCTLGLLYIAVDAWLVWTAAGLVDNSVVFENYWWALAVAVIINVARTLVDAACGDLKR